MGSAFIISDTFVDASRRRLHQRRRYVSLTALIHMIIIILLFPIDYSEIIVPEVEGFVSKNTAHRPAINYSQQQQSSSITFVTSPTFKIAEFRHNRRRRKNGASIHIRSLFLYTLFATKTDGSLSSQVSSSSGSSNGNNTSIAATSSPPQPPKSLPSPELYLSLLQQQQVSAQTTQQYQQQLADLQNEIELKQNEINQQATSYQKDKTGLLNQISQLTSQLTSYQKKEEDSLDSDDIEDNDVVTKLQDELELLQGQLPLIQNMLKTEQIKNAELCERIEDLDTTLEYQQMEFDNIQKELQATIEAQQTQILQTEREFKNKEQQIQQNTTRTIQQLQNEIAQYNQAKATWNDQQQQYIKEQERLQKSIKEQKDQLVMNDKTIQQMEKKIQKLVDQPSDTNTLVSNMKQELDAERTKLMFAEQFLQDAREQFAIMEQSMEEQLSNQQIQIESLTKQLDQQAIDYSQQKSILEQQIQQEKDQVQMLLQQIEKEQFTSNKEINRLRYLYNEEVRLRKIKKDIMNNRYENIRKELTALWQNALRDSRKQQQALINKYETKMSTIQSTMNGLQGQISVLQSDKDTLLLQVSELTNQRDIAIRQQKETEMKYNTIVSEKNQQIRILENSLQTLQVQIQNQNTSSTEFQNSIRQMMKQSISLGIQRIVKPLKKRS